MTFIEVIPNFFYNLDLLKSVSDYASSNNLIVSVITNAFWAKAKEEAISILANLSSIKMISVSTDMEHQKFIPIKNIKNAVWAFKKLGIIYNVSVTTSDLQSEKYLQIFDELLEITEKENILTGITIQLGRAKTNKSNSDFKKTTRPDDYACSMANFPILFPNGDVIACIGSPIAIPPPHPLYLGNLKNESLASILDRAQNNFILQAIRVWGPSELIRLLKEFGYESILPDEYIADSICDVCCRLFSNIKTNELLENISSDRKFREKVAYGRLYYLEEYNMVEKLLMQNNKLA